MLLRIDSLHSLPPPPFASLEVWEDIIMLEKVWFGAFYSAFCLIWIQCKLI